MPLKFVHDLTLTQKMPLAVADMALHELPDAFDCPLYTFLAPAGCFNIEKPRDDASGGALGRANED